MIDDLAGRLILAAIGLACMAGGWACWSVQTGRTRPLILSALTTTGLAAIVLVIALLQGPG